MRTIEELKRDYQATLWDIKALPGNLLYGVYEGYIKLPDCGTCSVVWGYNENGWEHVSVSPKKKDVLPTWNDMARLKEIFFYPEEEAYQIMPKESEYVNFEENCLHIYRPANGRLLREIIELPRERERESDVRLEPEKEQANSYFEKMGFFQKADELTKLLLENPGVPLLFMAGEDANIGDYSTMTCSSISYELTEALDYDYGDRIYTDRDEFRDDFESDNWDDWCESYKYLSDEPDPVREEKFQEYISEKIKGYDSHWRKCILVTVDN